MKLPALVALICSIFCLSACGGGPSTTSSSSGAAAEGSTTEARDAGAQSNATSPDGPSIPKQPKVRVPSGPPPKQLVVKEIKRGSGRVLKLKDKFSFRYVGVEYRSGKVFEARWEQPFIIQALGNGELLVGEERGMLGMRVGGRRKLIIPERLAYTNGVGALVYLIELVSVERGLT